MAKHRGTSDSELIVAAFVANHPRLNCDLPLAVLVAMDLTVVEELGHDLGCPLVIIGHLLQCVDLFLELFLLQLQLLGHRLSYLLSYPVGVYLGLRTTSLGPDFEEVSTGTFIGG